MKTVSHAVSQDSAEHKVVFVATDGLENSSVATFYAHNTVRKIDARAEFAKAKANDMLGSFDGAKIYVLGAAMMPPATHGTRVIRDGYRDPNTLRDLKAFWIDYFKASGANLVEFGEPALLELVSY